MNLRNLAAFWDHAERFGVRDHVVVTEPQPLGEAPHFLAACDVGVVPRPHSPGFPIKILNILAAARPCVLFASSSGGLTHAENAYLVSRDTSAALAEGLLNVLRNPDLRVRLGEQGREYVRRHRNRRVTAAQVSSAYLRTLEAARQSRRLANRSSIPVGWAERSESHQEPAVGWAERSESHQEPSAAPAEGHPAIGGL